jgi:hypothetical protein
MVWAHPHEGEIPVRVFVHTVFNHVDGVGQQSTSLFSRESLRLWHNSLFHRNLVQHVIKILGVDFRQIQFITSAEAALWTNSHPPRMQAREMETVHSRAW